MIVLQKEYGLKQPTLVQLGSTGGAIKRVYRVEAEGRAYLFKRYRADFRAPADALAIHRSQVYLQRCGGGVPVAPVVPTRGGELVAQDEAGDSWVLYAWIEGRHPQPGAITPREAAVLGESLALLDQALAGWQTDWAGAEPFQAYPVREHSALYEELLRHAERGTTETDTRCVTALRQRLGSLERMAGVAERIVRMERQWVHGDPNEGNILMAGEQVAVFLDFDNMRRAPRGFDFMYSLVSCFPAAGAARDAYARAYLDVVRPPAAELELYPWIYAYWLACDVWPIDVRYLDPAAFDPAWRIDPYNDRWEREAGSLTEWLLHL